MVPLSIQLLIENAVKHNIISANQVLLIEIRLNEPGKELLVINSVNKRKNVVSTGVGLQSLERRYLLKVGSPTVVREDSERFVVSIPLVEGA